MISSVAWFHSPEEREPSKLEDRGHDSRLIALRRFHSITLSARASSVGGTSRPSALAVLRFRTRLNLTGACTVRSLALSPLRRRSTYDAARRSRSTVSTP